MSNLKVVQLLPELNIGGVERGTKDFSKALIDKGHKSIVISNGGIFEKDIINDGTGKPKKYTEKSIELSYSLKLAFKQPLRQTEGFINSI